MAQFGNRMFGGGAVPGLLGGISDMMFRKPRPNPAVDPNMVGGRGYEGQPQIGGGSLGGPDVYRGLVEGVANGFRPSLGGPSADLPGRGNEGTIPPKNVFIPPRGRPIDGAPATPAVMPPSWGSGPTNYPGIERPMPPAMGGSAGVHMLPPGAGGPTNYPGIERPMPPAMGGYNPNLPGRGNEGRFPPGAVPPRQNRPYYPGSGSGVEPGPGFNRPMPPAMGGSVGFGMRPPGAGPIGGNIFPGGERPGTFYRPTSDIERPMQLPRGPRGLMRSR